MLESLEDNAISKTISVMNDYPEFVNLQTLDMVLFEDLRVSIDDDMFFSELMTTYLQSTAQLMDEIQDAFTNQDAYKFVISAHSLKSINASIGATRLSQISKYLEKASTTAEINVSNDILHLLNHEYAEVVKTIQTHILEFMAQ